LDVLLVQALTGLASGSALFLAAAGLTVIFGVTRVVNFSHGSLVMLGAYLGVTILPLLPRDPAGFAAGVLATAALVALIGVALEILLLRRIYRAPELLQLLATFGVVLMAQDAALWLWGPDDRTLPRPPWMRGFVDIAGQRFPVWDLTLIAIGAAVLGLVWVILRRTRFGVLIRAATENRDLAAALGVNQRALFTAVFALGAGLAGAAGALMLPAGSANLHIDLAIIADAFVVVVVGGMGSLPGAYIAALLIGVLQALGIVFLPKITLVLVFLIMAVVLAIRPRGLLGGALVEPRHLPPPPIGPTPAPVPWLGAAALALALAAPAFANPHTLSILTEAAVAVLFAASLHLMMGPGGMASFGHAAWFGIGAYAVGLAIKFAALPFPLPLLLAPLAAGLLAAVFALLLVRLAGVYLAMLTLAFAQIVWAATFQWVEITGGDNGILSLWPPEALGTHGFYYVALLVSVGAALLLRVMLRAPFGHALRAARDSELRAEAIGLSVRRLRIAAVTICGAAAGLSGGIFAQAKGSVFPGYGAISHSVDALLMVLLGGVQTLSGPIVGAIAYTGLYDKLLGATQSWRFVLGAAIVTLVLAFPDGIAGAALRWHAKWNARR